MSDLTIQGGFGIYTGYASAVIVQRLHVPRGPNRGRSSAKS